MGNGTSKYFKSTSTSKASVSSNSGRAGGGGVGSAAAKVAARRAKEIAAAAKTARNTRLSDDRIQRANLPSEVAKQYAQPANTRPIFPRSTRTAYDINADKAFNSTANVNTISAKENAEINTAFSNVNSYSQGNGAMSAASKPRTALPSITSLSTRDGGTSGSLFDMSRISGISSAKSKVRTTMGTETLGFPSNANNNEVNSLSGTNLSVNNNTVAPVTNDKYNQAYYAKLKANGMSTANILDIQKQAPGGKAYGGSTIVSEDQSRRAKDTLSRVTGSDAVLGDGVTRKYTQSGLFGENIKGEFNYKDGTKITTLADDPVIRGKFNEKTGRIEGGFRVGSRQVTTFAGNGNYTGATAGTGASTTGESYAVNTMSGGEDGLGGNAKTTTLTAKQSATLTNVLDGTVKLDDIVEAATVTTVITAITTIPEIDKLIEETTIPEILKSLYQRRLSLMRMNRTRTRFAGLLDDPDTKRTNLMSIS